jgi:selenide,water dikinase
VLQEILAKTPAAREYANEIVGIETGDDAAISAECATGAGPPTTGFFTPVVDDPFAFGRIAVTNAMSMSSP